MSLSIAKAAIEHILRTHRYELTQELGALFLIDDKSGEKIRIDNPGEKR